MRNAFLYNLEKKDSCGNFAQLFVTLTTSKLLRLGNNQINLGFALILSRLSKVYASITLHSLL